MAAKTNEQGPHLVDRHVGARIRKRRRALGMSQDDLAGSVGLTFQQIQKYERGANRVSASKLYQMSSALQAPVAFFFEGYADNARAPGVTEEESPPFTRDLPLTPEERELVHLFGQLDSRRMRRQILGLVRAIAEESSGRSAPDEPSE